MKTNTLNDLWRAYGDSLDSAQPNLKLLRDARLGAASSALRKLSRGVLAEVLVAVPLLALLVSFAASNIGSPQHLLPALALLAMTIAQLAFGIYQLDALNSLDFAAPVLALQKRLAELRIRRIRVTQWTLLVSPLLWAPMLLVLIKGLLGVNPYAILDATWLAANVIFGIAVIPLGWWASRRFARRFGHTRFMRRLMDDIGGQSLADAVAHLDHLVQFESELERA